MNLSAGRLTLFQLNVTTNIGHTGEGRRRVISPPCFCIRPARKRGTKQRGQRWRDGNLHHAGTSHLQNCTRNISVESSSGLQDPSVHARMLTLTAVPGPPSGTPKAFTSSLDSASARTRTGGTAGGTCSRRTAAWLNPTTTSSPSLLSGSGRTKVLQPLPSMFLRHIPEFQLRPMGN